MALKDLIRPAPPPPTPASERPPGITCENYTRGEDKRCIHYAKTGACLLPDEFMCVEWLKANGHGKRALPVANEPPEPTAPPARDLFGNPLPEPTATAPATPKAPTPVPPIAIAPKPETDAAPAVDVDHLRGFTTDDIESFKALGVEVRLRSEALGDVWLVPAYTGKRRTEITPEHAATLARVMSVFPGSQIVSFDKPKPTPTTAERRERPSKERS